MNIVNKLKNKIVILSLLLIVVSVGITFAVLQAKSNSLSNTFVVKSVDTDIDEPDVVVDDGKIIKQPYIINSTSGPALVRAKVSITPQEIKEDFNIEVKINSNYWVEYDGYYYYKDILQSGINSEPIFTEVTGKNLVTDDNNINTDLAGLEIIVYHESVQPVIGDIKASTGERMLGNNTDKIWAIYEGLNN